MTGAEWAWFVGSPIALLIGLLGRVYGPFGMRLPMLYAGLVVGTVLAGIGATGGRVGFSIIFGSLFGAILAWAADYGARYGEQIRSKSDGD